MRAVPSAGGCVPAWVGERRLGARRAEGRSRWGLRGLPQSVEGEKSLI